MQVSMEWLVIGVLLVTNLSSSHGFASQYFENFCGKTLNIGDGGDTMESGTGWLDSNYSPDLDCTVTLSTTATRKILLTWTSFNVESLNDTFGSCVDSLKIYDGVNKNLGSTLNLNKQCGFFSEYPETVSTGNTMTLHLKTNGTGTNNEFYFVYTSFTTAPCADDDWKCDNGRCISDDVAFDFNDNCGDGSDQDNITDIVTGILKWGIAVLVAIIIGIIIVAVALCVCCACCIYHVCCKNTSANQTTVVHAPPSHPQDPGMPMHGYNNNGYGNKI